MKLSRIKIGIITLATLTVVGAGVATATIASNKKEVTPDNSSVVITKPEDLKKSDHITPVNPTPVSEPQVPLTPAPEPSPEPVVVRSFEEIVLDYPNMSTGAPGFPECAGYLKNAYPERFRDDNREESIRYISEKFINVCAAIDLKTTRAEMTTLQFYWGR